MMSDDSWAHRAGLYPPSMPPPCAPVLSPRVLQQQAAHGPGGLSGLGYLHEARTILR